MTQQYGLGRGLASLIPPKKKEVGKETAEPSPFAIHPSLRSLPSDRDASQPVVAFGTAVPVMSKNGVGQQIPIENIVPNPEQPRLRFDDVKLEELAESIREHGILQPLIVSPLASETGQDGERYELIAGERRLQAAKRSGLTTVPVIIRNVTEQEKLELAIVENIQRHDLNPIEEAKAYLRLIDEFGLKQDEVAKKMSLSRSAVANTLRLLRLPVEIQRAVSEGKITEGHAKALLAIENPEKQRAVFNLIIKEELTVRETELRVSSVSGKSHIRSAVPLHPDLLAHLEHLTQILNTKVKITPVGRGGKVVIEYYSSEELDGLLKRLEE